MTIETPAAEPLLPLGVRMMQPDFIRRCEEVSARFKSAQLGDFALRLAKVHPYAADYIEQAPVLVLACHVLRRNRPESQGTARRAPPTQRDPRSDRIEARTKDILAWWRDRVDRGMKLGALMRSFKIAPEFRVLKHAALKPGNMWPITIMSKQMTGPEIAPIIPKTSAAQRIWLKCVADWYGHMLRRNTRALTGHPPGLDHPTCLTTWAANAFGRGPHPRTGSTVAVELADFALVFSNRTPPDPDHRFDPRWTLIQAAEACGRWHNRDGAGDEMNDLGFVRQYNVQPDWPAPCAGFPDVIPIGGGWSAVLLRTGRDLYREHVALSHCVDSYFGNVKHGDSTIYSIRENGMSVATLELRKYHEVSDASNVGGAHPPPAETATTAAERRDLPVWVPSQFRAKSNHAPLAAAWQAAAWAITALQAAGIDVSLTADTRMPSAGLFREVLRLRKAAGL